MLSPELAERSSRQEKNVNRANRYEWIAVGPEVAARSGPTSIEIQIEHQTNCCRTKQISARESLAKMRQKFDAAARRSTEEQTLQTREGASAAFGKLQAVA